MVNLGFSLVRLLATRWLPCWMVVMVSVEAAWGQDHQLEAAVLTMSQTSPWQPGVARLLQQLFIQPPACFLTGSAVAAGLWWWGCRRQRLGWQRSGKVLLLLVWLLAWGMSTKFVAYRALASIEPVRWLVLSQPFEGLPTPPQAIVVLGGGRSRMPTEYGEVNIRQFTLERVRYAAQLAAATRLPVLVTGGNPEIAGSSEASIMHRTLENEFHQPVQWEEGHSNTTSENARLSATLLRQAGIERVFVVTHGWHMRRAQHEFERAGLQVVPAPCGRTGYDGLYLADLIPNAEAMQMMALYLRESVGWLWYGVAETLGWDKS